MHQFAVKLLGEIERFLDPSRPRWRKLHELIRHRHELYDHDWQRLADVLRKLARDADSLADGFLRAPTGNDRKLTQLALLADRIIEDTAKVKVLVRQLDRRDVLDGLKQQVTLRALETASDER
jgi:hypothetical protein